MIIIQDIAVSEETCCGVDSQHLILQMSAAILRYFCMP
jgi:hypothetical protein